VDVLLLKDHKVRLLILSASFIRQKVGREDEKPPHLGMGVLNTTLMYIEKEVLSQFEIERYGLYWLFLISPIIYDYFVYSVNVQIAHIAHITT
jgi:hypothetical protein